MSADTRNLIVGALLAVMAVGMAFVIVGALRPEDSLAATLVAVGGGVSVTAGVVSVALTRMRFPR